MLDRAKEFINSRDGTKEHTVKEALKMLIHNNPFVSKVYLMGSYAKGDWLDKDTPEWFRKFRSTYKPDKEQSDVDFYTEPLVEPATGYDIIQHKIRRNILIYDSSKTEI